MKFNNSISNLLIYISVFFTFIAFLHPDLYKLSINDDFLYTDKFYLVFIQFFTGTFLHGNITHILFNSIFIYYFGNILELIIGKKKFIIFFLFSTIFIGTLLLLTTNTKTIGISGFAMALLSYYTLELRSKNNPEYKGGITAIIINVGIGIMPQISLYGHLYGVIVGIIFYILNKHFFTPRLVGLIDFDGKDVKLNNI